MKMIKCIVISIIMALTFYQTPYTDKVHIGSEEEKYLYLSMNNEMLENIGENNPIKLEVIIDHEGALECLELTQAEKIQEAVSYFMNIRIVQETNTVITDAYNSIEFTFHDYESVYISLNGDNLEQRVDGKYHYFELDGLNTFLEKVKELDANERPQIRKN